MVIKSTSYQIIVQHLFAPGFFGIVIACKSAVVNKKGFQEDIEL
jgi:hypothetical protein